MYGEWFESERVVELIFDSTSSHTPLAGTDTTAAHTVTQIKNDRQAVQATRCTNDHHNNTRAGGSPGHLARLHSHH